MKNPGKAASGSGSGGDAGHRSLAFWLQPAAGCLPWDPVRLSAAFGNQTSHGCGCAVFSGGGVGLDLHLLLGLPGRHPTRLLIWHGCRNASVGKNLRAVVAAGIFRLLAVCHSAFPCLLVSMEKIFGICKNFVCICGKMGYNKVYENL